MPYEHARQIPGHHTAGDQNCPGQLQPHTHVGRNVAPLPISGASDPSVSVRFDQVDRIVVVNQHGCNPDVLKNVLVPFGHSGRQKLWCMPHLVNTTVACATGKFHNRLLGRHESPHDI